MLTATGSWGICKPSLLGGPGEIYESGRTGCKREKSISMVTVTVSSCWPDSLSHLHQFIRGKVPDPGSSAVPGSPSQRGALLPPPRGVLSADHEVPAQRPRKSFHYLGNFLSHLFSHLRNEMNPGRGQSLARERSSCLGQAGRSPWARGTGGSGVSQGRGPRAVLDPQLHWEPQSGGTIRMPSDPGWPWGRGQGPLAILLCAPHPASPTCRGASVIPHRKGSVSL